MPGFYSIAYPYFTMQCINNTEQLLGQHSLLTPRA